MKNNFNPKTPDVPGIQYYSYGASLEPTLWSVFRPSYKIIKQLEGAPNDGLVRFVFRNLDIHVYTDSSTSVCRAVNGVNIKARSLASVISILSIGRTG
jgi:hypothetical protein